jgi:geranylgeranyl diphosphate synthase type II
MQQGGKRLRPVLTLLACDMLGGNLHKALNPALGIEIFHNFTLVHDDIMDQAPLRRNKETVYKKWNTNIAILSGDTMFAIAYDYLIRTDPDLLYLILPLFNQTAIEVCEGQQLDMEFETRHDVSIAEYLEMIRLKTAVLIATSLRTGAIIARAPEAVCRDMYNLGINVGLAFQLIDDVLDVYSNPDTFGKISGNDIITNKRTFLYLKAYEKAGSAEKRELDTCFGTREMENEEKVNRVKAVYSTLGIREEALTMVGLYYEKAGSLLDGVPVSAGQKKELGDFMARLNIRVA